MSWQLASFLVLGLALLAGFTWYERSHPTSKVLALVATLAALAALGRLAFAPLPNIKPTTDIVLIAGYVLGGAPGFAVGAVSALASNVVLGHGPWTPWQMGAWGLCGVFGAFLAVTFGRDLSRWSLAAACCVAGLGYGVILDFSTWVTFSGTHTLAQYIAIAASSLWFNVAHAFGNVVFCLAFGPLLIRTLRRYRARFDVTWQPLPAPSAVGGAIRPAGGVLASLLAVAVLAAGALAVSGTAAPGVAQASGPVAEASAAPAATVRFLERAQNADGGFGAAAGTRSEALYSGWVVMGLAAAGERPTRVKRSGGRSATAYLRSGLSRIRSTGDLERTILALRAAGVGVRKIGGRDLLAELVRRRDANGSFDGLVNLTSFGILAMRAAGRSTKDTTVRRAASWIAKQQNRDGGFSFSRRGSSSGVDDTAAAVQALVAAGRSRTKGAVPRAVGYLLRRQRPDGGFGGGSSSTRSNAQSTAFAIQALRAAGRDISRVKRNGSRTPTAYLRSLIASDGSVRYSRTSRQTPVWVTAQAVAALAGKPLPIRR
jgi:energy-coupling factor transport system substrate-specific component